MNRAQRLNEALADRLGDALTPSWRNVFLRTPRHLFVPNHGWRVADGSNEKTVIDFGSDPDGWLDAVYSDDIIYTHQVSAGDEGPSSNSMPYMVTTMLRLLDVEPSHIVGEIGTGSGWTSALLAQDLRSQMSVYTVEVDRKVAMRAAENLLKLGLTDINRFTADGAKGFPGVMLNRLLATCTVHRVPYAWVEQTCPGGVILTPWGSDLHNGALLKLTVDDFGNASGQFVHTSAFMWLRDQQFEAAGEPNDFWERADTSHVGRQKALLFDPNAMFTAGLHVPRCDLKFDRNDDEERTTRTAWLLGTDSWAAIGQDGTVGQLGPRRLWDEVANAHALWEDAGQPEFSRYGVTITKDEQTVWLDEPPNVVTHAVAVGGE